MSTEQQDTTYLSEAQISDIHGKASLADPLLRPVNRAVVLKVIELAAPFLEQKGAEGERQRIRDGLEERMADWLLEEVRKAERQRVEALIFDDTKILGDLSFLDILMGAEHGEEEVTLLREAWDPLLASLSEKETDQPGEESSRG